METEAKHRHIRVDMLRREVTQLKTSFELVQKENKALLIENKFLEKELRKHDSDLLLPAVRMKKVKSEDCELDSDEDSLNLSF